MNPTIIQRGHPILIGVKPEWAAAPITNLPPDTVKVRRRFRRNSFGKAFVKTSTGIQEWVLLADGDDGLRLGVLRGVNARQI